MMAKSLQQENDILRYQLNDLINREKNQRLELQRLRAHRDVEVSALVNAATQKLKGEIERVKGLLEPAASSLAQAMSDKDKVVVEKEELLAEMAKLKKTIEEDSSTYGGRLRNLESIMQKSSAMANSILTSVEAFQRHVLPNFKVVNTKINKCHTSDADGPNKIIDDMQRLEAGVALLRVIVDAKNDTLVLIRGKLKQENDDLRAELKEAKEDKPSLKQAAAVTDKVQSCADEVGIEKNILREEIHALQELYAAKFKQLHTKLKAHEEAEIVHQTRYCDIRNECHSLQTQLSTMEASRRQLEENLKDETSARSQLVTEIFHMRKENEALKSELDMLKVNQKFFGGHGRKGRLPMDKMDLINTVNQLLFENSKLKSDKTQLEEEVKTQRRSNVLERVQSNVTPRDLALCASNKVGDSEIANKLARIRLQHLGGQSSPTMALTNGYPGAISNPFMQAGDPTPGIAGWSSPCEDPTRAAAMNKKVADVFESGQTGLAQLAGLRERGILRE
ncbi:hypothetical protein M758_6G136400 [Ceratodon purpureus]|nr:hypothetical protein M758_6G136400 [Ceratodon purpureus]